MKSDYFTRIAVAAFSLLPALSLLLPFEGQAAQTNLVAPPGSGAFGSTVIVLPNGNIVVTDPDYNEVALKIGAVHLYDGATLALISTLKGSTANDHVGNFGITVLSNGNYVVVSPNWDNPSPLRIEAGAVTWCSGTTGLAGVVSAANSLIGISSNNFVGRGALNNGVVALANGNYVVANVFWDNPSTPPDVGAITFCNGTTGRIGFVDASNSLIGSRTNDRLGGVVVALPNGNYVLGNYLWDNPATGVTDAGAVTWASGTTGITGLINATNSLIGSTSGDFTSASVTVLTNANYVVCALNWDNLSPPTVNAGAVVYCNGTTGRTGLISSANALIGGTANDVVGNCGAKVLANGNYVVSTPNWTKPSPTRANVGAVTLCNGTTGLTGLVTAANSLTGETAVDLISSGAPGITILPNGDYVVASQFWNNPSPAKAFVGAVTLCSGTTGRAGQIVSITNSVVGSTANDYLCRVVALANGNYVVSSRDWDNPSPAKVDVGVAALCSGLTGRTGTLNSANALVGSTAQDRLSDSGGVVPLANGNYVVVCSSWDNAATASNNVGAVTFCNGTTGRTGELSPGNSLVGLIDGSRVGGNYVIPLANGNYVVGSPSWNDALSSIGAATWCDGLTGRTGLVSFANSLVGSSAGDSVADDDLIAFPDGNYMVTSSVWRNGGVASAGAVTLGDGTRGVSGTINATNSVLGTVANAFDTFSPYYSYDPVRSRLVVGRSVQNIVTVFTLETPPKLSITRAGNQATISWTPNTPGYVLQQTSLLSPTTWTNAPSGSTNPITLSATNASKFYRLFKL